MNNYFKILSFAFLVLFVSCNNEAVKKGGDEIDQKVGDLLSKMTLEEKVGQMNQYNGFYDVTGPAPQEGVAKDKFDHLKKGLVGSMLNVRGVEETRKVQKIVVEESRLGIPLIIGFDVIHGYKTVAPIPLGEAASWDLESIKKSASVAAAEASAVGINWTFAPMVDISRDARWGRVMEGAGEDPYLGSKIAVARVQGFQGDDLSADNTIAACAKHFAGYGFAEAGRDYNTVDIGTSTLYNIVLPPFKAAAQEGGVRTFMNAFNVLNGVPSTGNSFLQRDILKGSWDWNGFVVSDWGSIREMVPHGFAADLKEASMHGANAGSDMDMESYGYVNHLVDLVNEGKVSEDKVDDAVRRILRVKFELGLFDDPYKYYDEEREKNMLYHEDHMEAVYEMAKKSIVLLKNDKNILPLSKNQKGIAIIGALADDKTSPLGSWRGGSDDNTAVSVLEGVKKYADFKYAKGADLVTGAVSFVEEMTVNTSDKSGFAKAVNLAKKSETVIMVLGEHGFMSGEGRSRSDIGLPGVQQELLEEVYKVNKNVILVLMNGRPLAISWAAENLPAIVETWHLGTRSGDAIADVLFGEYNPSGKLPMSFPRNVGQVPIYYNHYNTGRPGNGEGNVFWSHYSDVENTPLYPFGYGLSYSQFKYSDLKVDDSNAKEIKVSVNIKNTSNVDGEEVVQLYIHDKFASVARPVKELKGFEKVLIKANSTATVSFVLTEKELGFYDNNGKFIVENGEFDLLVGTNSQEGIKGSFELK
jgi:beta-glucosidase